jgi:hypothetical protein
MFADHATPVGLDVFDSAVSELDPAWYALEWREVRGRQSVTTAD